jgi:nucleoside-diphosphate-sugar epimerase
MPKHAFIIGAGQIGRACADALRQAGWAVRIGTRSVPLEPGEDWVMMDRCLPGGLAAALGSGADLLVDTIGFDVDAADQLLGVQGGVAHLLTISSASVYRDDAGRTLDEAAQTGFPDLPAPITETQPTVEPGPQTYSTRKVAMERRLLDHARVPATVLRPCAVHGPWSRHPREWWFVKRLLDGRRRIPLAHAGRSRFQTTATANIAALVVAAARGQAGGIYNAADPDSPDVEEIATAIMTTLGIDAELLPVGAGDRSLLGRTPWSIPAPFLLSDASARSIGYRPVGSYADTVVPAVHWLARLPTSGWGTRFPDLARYPWPLFDYAAEDAAL